jgi:hypothetical protein
LGSKYLDRALSGLRIVILSKGSCLCVGFGDGFLANCARKIAGVCLFAEAIVVVVVVCWWCGVEEEERKRTGQECVGGHEC